MQNVISYEIEWSMTKVNILKGIYYVPFKIIAQTSDKSLESFCLSKWPQLMYQHPYTNIELREFIKMQMYLKKELNSKHKIFNDGCYVYLDAHGWFSNILVTDNVFNITYDEIDCKMWNDKLPHLQAHGIISCDIKRTIDIFDKNKWIKYEKYAKNLLSEKFIVRFNKALPTIYTFSFSSSINDILLNKVNLEINNPKSNIYKQIQNAYKVKNIEKYNKTIERLEYGKYQVTFTNFIDILKLRTKNHKLETAAGIYYAAKVFQNKKQQKLIKNKMKHITFQKLYDLKNTVRKK